MRIHLLVAALLLAGTPVFAQSTQGSQTSGQSTGMPGMQMGSGQKSQTMSEMHQQMQADLQQMKAQVDKMRADAQKVQDANTKAALLDNADTWDQFLTRMQSHMQMMNSMHGGMSGMHHKPTKPGSSKSSTANPK